MSKPDARWVTGLAAVLVTVLAAAPVVHGPAGQVLGQSEPELQRALATFFQTSDLRVDAVPDLYPGGYARISVYVRRASLGGMRVDEAWFRLIGATVDLPALHRGEFKVTDARDSAMYLRATLKSLEEYFTAGNAFKDIRVWSDGEFLYGEGTVPLGGLAVKVWLKGFFAVDGTKDVYFHIDNLRVNGLPVLSPLIRLLEARYNPVFSQSTWPVTFVIRSIKLGREAFVVSSQPDPDAPCAFCTGGDAPGTAP